MPTEGQPDREDAPSVRRAGGVDLPAMLLDDAVADAQAEAGPLPHRLCGEERLEDPAEVFFGDSGAVVLDFHLDGAFHRPGSNPDIPAFPNSLESVQQQ